MVSAFAPLIRTVLSLVVALTLAFGLVCAPAGAGASEPAAEAACASAHPGDTDADDSRSGGPDAEAADDERFQEPILSQSSRLPDAPRARHAAPRRDLELSHRFASDHDRPPRLASASPRSGDDRQG